MELPVETLRQRQSEKWRAFPPDVVPAFVAEMDFALAPAIRDALVHAIELGDTGYAFGADVRAPFAQFAARRYAWNLDERCVFAVPDVMAGITQAFELLTQEGDGVVINPPVYPPFFEVVPRARRRIVEVPLQRSDDATYALDFASLEHAFAQGAGAYLLCSPHNPIGRVWSRDDLARIVTLCEQYDVALIADEIHAPLVLPGATFTPVAAVASERTRYIAMHSASKGWNIAGLKCGLMIPAPRLRDALHEQLARVPTEIASRVGHFGVLASIAAFRDSVAWLDELLILLDRNRTRVETLVSQRLPEARWTPPQATYLAWLDFSAYGDDVAARCLSNGRVAVENGTRFGADARFVRVNFGTSSTLLEEIVDRMASALSPNG